MSKSTPGADKSSATILSGPKHNYLGSDADGDHHHYDRAAETVTVISQTGTREYQYNVDDLTTWVNYVADRRGWDDLRYIDLRGFKPEVLR